MRQPTKAAAQRAQAIARMRAAWPDGSRRFPDRCNSSRRDSTTACSRRISSDGTPWLRLQNHPRRCCECVGTGLQVEGRLGTRLILRVGACVSGRGCLVSCSASVLLPEKRGRSTAVWRGAGEAKAGRRDPWGIGSASLSVTIATFQVPGNAGEACAHVTMTRIECVAGRNGDEFYAPSVIVRYSRKR
jgi:hypothetical protein